MTRSSKDKDDNGSGTPKSNVSCLVCDTANKRLLSSRALRLGQPIRCTLIVPPANVPVSLLCCTPCCFVSHHPVPCAPPSPSPVVCHHGGACWGTMSVFISGSGCTICTSTLDVAETSFNTEYRRMHSQCGCSLQKAAPVKQSLSSGACGIERAGECAHCFNYSNTANTLNTHTMPQRATALPQHPGAAGFKTEFWQRGGKKAEDAQRVWV